MIARRVLTLLFLAARCGVALRAPSVSVRSAPRLRARAVAAPAADAASGSGGVLAGAGGAGLLAWREVAAASRFADRRPVIVLHGLLGSKRNFRSFTDALAGATARKRRVLAFDLRCHGGSFGDSDMSYGVMARDVLATLDAAGIGECALVGHSMGGKVAMVCALADARVRELVVMDIAPTAYRVGDGSNWNESLGLIEALPALDLANLPDAAAADAALARAVPDHALRAFALTNLKKTPNGLKWKCDLDSIRANLGPLAAWDIADAGPLRRAIEARGAFKGDALFLKGADSRYVRSVHVPVISRLFPSFTLQTVSGAGHWIHAENPAETLDFIRAYLDRD